MTPENSPNSESHYLKDQKQRLMPHLVEVVKIRLGMMDEVLDIPREQEVIVPLPGLEDKTFSLPEPAKDGTAGNTHFDDWIVTNEEYHDDDDNLRIDLARYRDDGSIEVRENLPADIFESYQVKVDAERRFKKAKEDENLGSDPVTMGRIRMIREIRDKPEWAELASEEQAVLAESRARLAAKREESLDRMKEQRAKERRENPLKHIRGKHRK